MQTVLFLYIFISLWSLEAILIKQTWAAVEFLHIWINIIYIEESRVPTLDITPCDSARIFTIEGQVQTGQLLFVSSSTNWLTSNFRLRDDIRRTKLTENYNVCLFCANRKRKRQTSSCLLQTEKENGRLFPLVSK